MKQIIDYAGNVIKTDDCFGCDFAMDKFSVPSGCVYKDDFFTVSQDWQIPIDGFLSVAPTRHIVNISELTDQERNDFFALANKTIGALKKVLPNVGYSLIVNEAGSHLHAWLLPRHDWMRELVGSAITKNLGEIFEYAKQHFRTQQHIQKIHDTCDSVRGMLL